MHNTCGYNGSFHFCSKNGVAFISRYHDTNDYCVDGRRVTLRDDGSMQSEQKDDRNRIRQFEQAKYELYVAEHASYVARYGADWPEILPFDCPA